MLCFAGLLLLGLAIYRDYGFSFDEGAQRVIGAVTVKHVVERFAPSLAKPSMASLPSLEEFPDKDYGVAFEAPAVALEVLLGLTDKRDVFLFRHLLTFLISLGGIYAVYRLAYRRFADRGIGLLAVAVLVLSPRLFADSFYNSKDSVFMAAFAMALSAMIAFVLKPRLSTAALHAVATAFAVDLRIVGIVLPMATIALLVARVAKREQSARQAFFPSAIYLAAAALLVVAMWPWLWADPLHRFAQAFVSMSGYQRWDGPVLYMGAFVRSLDLPWHYAPVWISITTPPLYLAMFLIGAVTTVRQFVASRLGLWRDDEELQDLVFLAMFAAPVAAVMLLHSALYDGWRHLYFIYPAFVLLAVKGWQVLWNWPAVPRLRRPAIAAVTAVSFAVTAAWMWRAHPFENVYFNQFAGSNLRARYELDYWGLSTRRGLEYVLSHDPADPVYVEAGSFMMLDTAAFLLPPQDRQRLRVTTDERLPHYLFTNYRMVDDTSDAQYRSRYDLFYQVKVDDEVILSVFKSRPSSGAR